TEYLNYFDKIIVVSESTKHILETQEYYNSIKDKIEVIYNVIDIEKIIEDKENTSKIIAEIMSCERPRPLEAASFTFRYNKVSLSGITHFARHRMQSLDVPQLTKTDRESYIIPPSLSDKPELLEKYKNAFKNNAKEYKRLKALGISEEDLVYYQLSGNTLDIVSTMNARELIL
ncbi:MAG: FAD-dependent thymidylate synthase, partial [Oscillospiraceae bacterium]